MSWPPGELRFLITSHAHLAGVRLSLRQSFGNIPFPNENAAEDEAASIAGKRAYTIERKSFPALASYRGAPR